MEKDTMIPPMHYVVITGDPAADGFNAAFCYADGYILLLIAYPLIGAFFSMITLCAIFEKLGYDMDRPKSKSPVGVKDSRWWDVAVWSGLIIGFLVFRWQFGSLPAI